MASKKYIIETPKKDYRNRRDECLDVSDGREVLPLDYGFLGQADPSNGLLNDPDYIKWLEDNSNER